MLVARRRAWLVLIGRAGWRGRLFREWRDDEEIRLRLNSAGGFLLSRRRRAKTNRNRSQTMKKLILLTSTILMAAAASAAPATNTAEEIIVTASRAGRTEAEMPGAKAEAGTVVSAVSSRLR